MTDRELTRRKLLNILACVLLILAVALLVLTFLMQINDVSSAYDEVLERLAEFEAAVASIPSKWLVILVIFLIYIGKVLIPLLKWLAAFFPDFSWLDFKGSVVDPGHLVPVAQTLSSFSLAGFYIAIVLWLTSFIYTRRDLQ